MVSKELPHFTSDSQQCKNTWAFIHLIRLFKMDFTTIQNQSSYVKDWMNNASSNGTNTTGNYSHTLSILTIIHLTIVCLGIPCNNIIIFVASKCLTVGFSRYKILLLYLAISDIIYLLSTFVGLSGIFGNIGIEGNWLNCCVINVFTFFSGLLSSWLIVLISFERFLCVNYPMRTHLYKGKVLLFVVLIILSIVLAGLSSLAFKLSYVHPEAKSCSFGTLSKTNYLNRALSMGVRFLYSIIPGVLVFSFNIAILHSLIKHVRNRNEYIDKSHTNESSTELHETRSVTVMLVATSFMFVICRTPYFTLELLLILFPSSSKILNLFHVGAIIDPFDHSVNLLVYCVSSSVFRSHVKDAMCWRNNK